MVSHKVQRRCIHETFLAFHWGWGLGGGGTKKHCEQRQGIESMCVFFPQASFDAICSDLYCKDNTVTMQDLNKVLSVCLALLLALYKCAAH